MVVAELVMLLREAAKLEGGVGFAGLSIVVLKLSPSFITSTTPAWLVSTKEFFANASSALSTRASVLVLF